MTPRLLGLLVLPALILAAACDDDDPPDLVAPVAIHDGTWNHDDALISGTLVEEDGCLVILAGDQRILPAFPDDDVIWDPPTHVLTVKGVEFRPGEEAAFGGSGRGGTDLPPGITWVNAPPNTCRYGSIWLAGPPSSAPTTR